MTFLRDWGKVIWGAVFNTTSGWSRAFWLYCTLLSLVTVPIGVGQIARAPTFSGGRVGPITSERGKPQAGVVILTLGAILVIVCLFNAYRARPKA